MIGFDDERHATGRRSTAEGKCFMVRMGKVVVLCTGLILMGFNCGGGWFSQDQVKGLLQDETHE